MERLGDVMMQVMGTAARRPARVAGQIVAGRGGDGEGEGCRICGGAGYTRADVPVGHPQFGKPIPCACKRAEWDERRRRRQVEHSHLAALQDRVFRSFDVQVPGVREAFQVAAAYARRPEGWLLLVGRSGCGKTHLAAAIANACLARGMAVNFVTAADLLDHLRATFAPASTVYFDQLFADLCGVEVLVLDDLGCQRQTPWAGEKLFQLLNARYNGRRPTVFTANGRGLVALDERVRSRLMDAALVQTVNLGQAGDYRQRHSGS